MIVGWGLLRRRPLLWAAAATVAVYAPLIALHPAPGSDDAGAGLWPYARLLSAPTGWAFRAVSGAPPWSRADAALGLALAVAPYLAADWALARFRAWARADAERDRAAADA